MLSLTKYIPYPQIAHAGGQYLLAHARALTAITQLSYLAPNTPNNRQALAHVTADMPRATLLPGAALSGALLALWRLESVWAGSAIYLPIRRLFATHRAPWGELAAAHVIELQWSEMIALAPLIRRRLPDSTLIGIAHDIITQRLDRQATRTHTHARRCLAPRQAALRIAAARSRRRESRSFRALDLLIVFSEKDAAIARALAPSLRVQVLHPGLEPADPRPRTPQPDAPIVLFTGAMNRPENHQAIRWFIDEIWQTVLADMPAARLVIAGAHPPAALSAQVAQTPRAHMTGLVNSLEPYYAEASVCIVPLRAGAGVKFKTIDALLRGIPTVTTTVGAEGIGQTTGDSVDAPAPKQLFAAVTDEADEFAAAVTAQLRAPNNDLARRAQAWATRVYGSDAFTQQLQQLYTELCATRTTAS